jgi:hypothetical protein
LYQYLLIMKNTSKLLIGLLVILFSVNQLFSQGQEKESLDPKLVGTWVGKEKDAQIEGMMKEWIMVRKANGSFELNFVVTYQGRKQTIQEKGRCWTKDGKFYEFHEASGNTDIYSYEVLNENQVRFTMESSASEFNEDVYTFIDTRQVETTNFDGGSFDRAVKVKGIPQEYNFIKKNCPGCKVESQSLVYHNNKPYDVLKCIREDGTEVSYYFDISSFYKKKL